MTDKECLAHLPSDHLSLVISFPISSNQSITGLNGQSNKTNGNINMPSVSCNVKQGLRVSSTTYKSVTLHLLVLSLNLHYSLLACHLDRIHAECFQLVITSENCQEDDSNDRPLMHANNGLNWMPHNDSWEALYWSNQRGSGTAPTAIFNIMNHRCNNLYNCTSMSGHCCVCCGWCIAVLIGTRCWLLAASRREDYYLFKLCLVRR